MKYFDSTIIEKQDFVKNRIQKAIGRKTLNIVWDDNFVHNIPMWERLLVRDNNRTVVEMIYDDIIVNNDASICESICNVYKLLNSKVLLVWETKLNEFIPVWTGIINLYDRYKCYDLEGMNKWNKFTNNALIEVTQRYLNKTYRIILPFTDTEYSIKERLLPMYVTENKIYELENINKMVNDSPVYYSMLLILSEYKERFAK